MITDQVYGGGNLVQCKVEGGGGWVGDNRQMGKEEKKGGSTNKIRGMQVIFLKKEKEFLYSLQRLDPERGINKANMV